MVMFEMRPVVPERVTLKMPLVNVVSAPSSKSYVSTLVNQKKKKKK